MIFEYGDIVEVFFDLPHSRETKLHPAIIISNYKVYDQDEIYICVMMTSSTNIDLFSFEITQEMLFNKNSKPFSQARCHLITYVKEKHFEKRPINKMKSIYVEQLVEKINLVCF